MSRTDQLIQFVLPNDNFDTMDIIYLISNASSFDTGTSWSFSFAVYLSLFLFMQKAFTVYFYAFNSIFPPYSLIILFRLFSTPFPFI